MSSSDPHGAAIDALRQAVQIAPDNLALVEHLAKYLLTLNRFDDATLVYRDALKHRPGNVRLQAGLADSYRRDGKLSHALAIVETLMDTHRDEPIVLLLHARLMHTKGESAAANASYREAIDIDPDARDTELESLIGYRDLNDPSEPPTRERLTSEGFSAANDEDEENTVPVSIERPAIGFSDVGGMEFVKEQVRIKLIYPLEHADMFAAYGKKIGGGVLMYGPPGCGKTHLARATAGEVKASFLSVGISDVLDMWIGKSEQNLHGIFQAARQGKPCVLFFDEVDALGASRSDMRHSAGRNLINQFLSELDGVDTNNDGVLCLAATNAPWHLDSAFRRPGRFDRVIFVPPPDQAAREQILEILVRGKPTDGIDVKKIAAKTDDFSGADLRAVVDVAVEAKLHDAIRSGKPQPLRTADLIVAAKSIRPSTKEWFSTARNHALYSNQGGVYDDILEYLKQRR
jgi:transitional endoplasmic reticulum ATPase